MELSEAMRLGAMLKPQAYLAAYDHQTNGSCAIGAAMDAIGRLHSGCDVNEEWPVLRRKTQYPGDPYCWQTVSSVVTQLNDFDGWTRERIADWVETIEQQQDVAAVTPDLVTVEA